MYQADIVAKYIICYCNNKGISISNLKLQKLLYFIQAEFLVAKDCPCFAEQIEAWDIGPVVPMVYHRYKVYGGGTIPSSKSEEPYCLCSDDLKLIDGIINECLVQRIFGQNNA